MAEPGWYNAAGDPAGTQRYWDGNQWLGDAVYEPAPSPPGLPVPGPAPAYAQVAMPAAPSTFSPVLKTVAIVLSVLKAIPLVLGGIVLIFIAAVASDFDDEFTGDDFGLDWLLGAAVLVLSVFFVIGALLLGFQFVGAIKGRPMMVFVPALIMSLFDGLATIGGWLSWNEARNSAFINEGPGGPVMITAVFVAQAYVAVQALRANSKQ